MVEPHQSANPREHTLDQEFRIFAVILMDDCQFPPNCLQYSPNPKSELHFCGSDYIRGYESHKSLK